MTQAAAQTTAFALDPATLGVLLHETVDSLPYHPQATEAERTTRREAACIAIAALLPRGPGEAMLATGIVAAHYHMMDNLRWAAQPDVPAELRLRLQGRAITLCNLALSTQKELDRRQAYPAVTGSPLPVPVPDARPAAPPAPVHQPAARAPAPVARPPAPVPAPQKGAAIAAGPAGKVPELDAALREGLLAEIARRASTSTAALAA
jgi:hypothetical protein